MSDLWESVENGGVELKVMGEHWYRVFGTQIVLAPEGIVQGVAATHEQAKKEAERMYRENLVKQVEQGERMAKFARAGLALLAGEPE